MSRQITKSLLFPTAPRRWLDHAPTFEALEVDLGYCLLSPYDFPILNLLLYKVLLFMGFMYSNIMSLEVPGMRGPCCHTYASPLAMAVT